MGRRAPASVIPNDLPFASTIRRGLRDLKETTRARNTIPALIVSTGSPRLTDLGIKLRRPIQGAEHKLYVALCRKFSARSAHSRYNALIRRLVSFERAYACVVQRMEDKHDAEVARKRARLKGIPYEQARRRLGLGES